jgi:hypothetical protein
VSLRDPYTIDLPAESGGFVVEYVGGQTLMEPQDRVCAIGPVSIFTVRMCITHEKGLGDDVA